MPITGAIARSARWTLPRLVALVVAAALLAACVDGATSSAAQDDTSSVPQDDTGAHGDASPVAANARHIEVSGRSFEFDPDEITVSTGEDIAIVLASEDGPHDFTLDDFDAHVAAEPGETGFGGFRAGEPGRYTFYCSVEGHREAGMEGVLVVGD